MENCTDCKITIDTENDTFVIIYGDNGKDEHVCFNCFRIRKGK